jgi:hypothetical protein
MPKRGDVVTDQLDELKTDFTALWVALTRDPKKEARKERAFTILTSALGAVAALGARRVATKAWGVLTGEAPPVARRPQRPANRRSA